MEEFKIFPDYKDKTYKQAQEDTSKRRQERKKKHENSDMR